MGLEDGLGPRDFTQDEVRKFLVGRGVDMSGWGKGTAKSLGDLVEEINAGETVLRKTNLGAERLVERVGVDVIYRGKNGDDLVLFEAKQVFRDGRERVRDVGYSFAEKIGLDRFGQREKPAAALKRGLLEELGIDTQPKRVVGAGVNEQKLESPSYPKLPMTIKTNGFVVELADKQFRPDGYVEDDGKKVTYFSWRKMSK